MGPVGAPKERVTTGIGVGTFGLENARTNLSGKMAVRTIAIPPCSILWLTRCADCGISFTLERNDKGAKI
jgi:hypothetical protein